MADDKEQALQLIQRFCDASKTKDPEQMLQFYTEDAILIGPGQPVVKGKDAVRKIFQGLFDIGAVELDKQDRVIEMAGHVAIYHGPYVTYGQGGKVIEQGVTLNILRKNETTGEWKMSHDMWN